MGIFKKVVSSVIKKGAQQHAKKAGLDKEETKVFLEKVSKASAPIVVKTGKEMTAIAVVAAVAGAVVAGPAVLAAITAKGTVAGSSVVAAKGGAAVIAAKGTTAAAVAAKSGSVLAVASGGVKVAQEIKPKVKTPYDKFASGGGGVSQSPIKTGSDFLGDMKINLPGGSGPRIAIPDVLKPDNNAGNPGSGIGAFLDKGAEFLDKADPIVKKGTWLLGGILDTVDTGLVNLGVSRPKPGKDYSASGDSKTKTAGMGGFGEISPLMVIGIGIFFLLMLFFKRPGSSGRRRY